MRIMGTASGCLLCSSAIRGCDAATACACAEARADLHYIFPISPPYLSYISPISPLYLRLRVRGGEGSLVTFEPAQRLRLSRLEELTW